MCNLSPLNNERQCQDNVPKKRRVFSSGIWVLTWNKMNILILLYHDGKNCWSIWARTKLYYFNKSFFLYRCYYIAVGNREKGIMQIKYGCIHINAVLKGAYVQRLKWNFMIVLTFQYHKMKSLPLFTSNLNRIHFLYLYINTYANNANP